MKLESLFIESYRGIENLKIAFGTSASNDNYFGNSKISVFVGENGTGKTTVFKLLTLAFCPHININDESPRFQIDYRIGSSINQIGSHQEVRDIQFPRKVLVSTFSVFDQFIIPERMIRDREEPKNYNVQYTYCGPLSNNSTSSLMSIIPIILEALLKTRKYNEQYEAYKKMMNVIGYGEIKYLELSGMMDFYGVRPTRSNLDEIDDSIFEERKSLRRELGRLRVRGKQASRRNNFLIDIDDMSEELLNKIFKLMEEDICPIRDLWMMRGNSEVPLTRMSSGELTMLFRFFPLISEIDHESIILIDEPETHLHPAWVQKYIYYLAEIFRDFRVHILLATHSPLIAADVPCECLIGLGRNEKNQIRQYQIKDKTLGGDPKSILKDVFKLSHFNGVFTSEVMDKIVKLIETDEKSIAKKMYHDLSTSREKYELFLKIEDDWE